MPPDDETQNELTPFQQEMISRFKGHSLNENAEHAVEVITNQFLKMTSFIDSYVPKGREQSLVLTKLEEAKMWAVKGIARSGS